MMIGEPDDYIDLENYFSDLDSVRIASREPIFRIPTSPPKDPVIYFKDGSSIRVANTTKEYISSNLNNIEFVAASEKSELEKFFEEYVRKNMTPRKPFVCHSLL